MAEPSSADPLTEPELLDVAVEEAIATCDGDLRATIRALIVANEFLESKSFGRRSLKATFVASATAVSSCLPF